MPKIYVDVEARKTGKGAQQTAAELGDLRARIKAAGDEAQRQNERWARSSKKAADEIAKNLNKIEKATGRVARSQAQMIATGGIRMPGGGGGRSAPHSGAGGSANFAGVGLLNLLGKAPGGQIWAPVAGLTGAIKGIGAAAAGITLLVAAFKGLQAAIGFTWESAKTLLRTFFDLTVQGYNYNAMLETTRAGTAAIISSFGEIVDVQGRVVTGTEKFNAALQISGAIQNALRKAAVQTAASYEQLVRVFQEGAAPAISKGFDASEITRLTIDMAQVAQAIGLPFDQLNQEIRGLLEGDVSRHSRIARVILADLRDEATKTGTTVEKELQKMAKLGTLPDFLHSRMIEFNKAAEMTANTLPVAMSNLRDAFQQALGNATAGGVGRVTQKIKELTDQIVTFDKFGNATFGKSFADGLGGMASMMTKLITLALELALRLDEIWFKLQRFGSQKPRDRASGILEASSSGMMQFLNPFNMQSKFLSWLLSSDRKVVESGDRPGLLARLEAEWKNEQDRRRQEEAAQAEMMRRRGQQMLMTRSYTYEGENARLNLPEGYSLKGISTEEFQSEIGRVMERGKAFEIFALIEGINKAFKEGDTILSLEEFNKILLNAAAGGNELTNAFKEANEELEKQSKIDALVNRYESLTQSIRGTSEAMRTLADRGAKMGVDMGRDIDVGKHTANIRQLETQIAQIEAKAGGDLAISDINAIENLQKRINLEKELIAQIKARAAAQDRVREIADLEADAGAKMARLAEQMSDLEKLHKQRAGMKTGSTAAKSIDEQIAEMERLIGATQDAYAQLWMKITELRRQSIDLQTQDEATAADERLKNDMEAAAAASEARKNIDDKTNKAIKRQHARLTRELMREWERFGDLLGRSVARAFEQVATGGDIRDAFAEIAGGIRDIIGAALQQTVSDWWASLSKIAAGQGSHPDDPRFPASAGQQRNAKLMQGGLIAMSAGYSIWNQRGPSRGANMMSGAMTGAAAGAQLATMTTAVGGIVGMVVGALVGAALGAFAPTGRKIGLRITSGANGLQVRGLGDAKAYQVEEAVREINNQIQTVRAGMFDILFNLPTHVITALTSNMRPKLPDFDKKIEPVTGAEDTIRDFITSVIPRKALEAYIPAVTEMANLLGVSKARTNELISHFRAHGADAKEVQKLVSEFFGHLVRLQEITRFGAMNIADRTRFAVNEINKTPAQRLEESAARITALIPKDFDKWSLEEQVEYANRLMPLIEERYQMELQYLAQIDSAMKESLKSIEDQIFELQMVDMTPQEQMDALLERQRAIKDAIRVAKTPEEIARLASEYQQNIARQVEIGGNRPEDRANAIAALQDLHKITEDAYKRLAAEVEAMSKPYFEQIQRILDALETGLQGVVGTNPNPGIENPIDGPFIPDDVRQHTVDSLNSLSDAANTAADRLKAVGSPDGEGGPVEGQKSVVVINPQPAQVVIQGDIGRFLTSWRAQTVQEAMVETIRVIDKRGARRRAGGRG